MPIDPMSWRSLTIEQAVDKIADPLIKRGLATKDRGYSEKAIAEAEALLTGPLPNDLRVFYRQVTPVPDCPEFGGGSVAFQALGDEYLTWLDDPRLREQRLWVGPQEECWLEGWSTARLLIIGYTEFGDWLLWCDGLVGRNVGTVVLTDHEGEINPVVVGDSFAQWLGRYLSFGFLEFSFAEAALDEIEPEAAKQYLRDYVRLNPTCVWAKEKLATL